MSSTVAIIPVRGGSKGVPHKNILPVAGKPLVAWNIEAALAAKHVDRVVVSTDASKIAEVSRAYGAEIIMRPADISGDSASSEAALLHTLDTLAEAEDYHPELTVFLQCTSPLTLPEDIDGAIEALTSQQADSALAVVDFHYFVWRPAGDSSDGASGGAVGVNHDKRVRKMRQEREPQYLETGAVYVMRTAGFRQAGHRFFGKTVMHEIPAERRLEIDDLADFDVAEMRLERRRQNRHIEQLPAQIDAVVFDFDGVFTDNRVILSEDGTESATCSRGDGMGIGLLKKTGLPLLVLSKEPVPIVVKRCEKLGLECLHGIDDKLRRLKQWLDEHDCELKNTVYVGNDINDLDCLAAAGCGVVPADAHPDVFPVANLVLTKPGGGGAVRELCDLIRGRVL